MQYSYLDHISKRFFTEVFNSLFETEMKCPLNSGFSSSGNSFEFSIPVADFFKYTNIYDLELKTVSHFTSLPVLFSILNSESIRLYNLDHVNDPHEYSYALPAKYSNKLNRQKSSLYIMSNCLFDEMSIAEKHKMWDGYGSKGLGVRLEIMILKGKSKYSENVFTKKVSYSNLNIDKFLAAKQKLEQEENLDEIEFLKTLRAPCTLHKNPAYELEREVRLVYVNDGREDRVFSALYNDSTPFYEDYSNNSKGISKYYNLKINDPKELAHVVINQIELGYKHKGNNDLLYHLQMLCLHKRNSLNHIGVKFSDLENPGY